MATFSYRKFTELQIQGARDRALRKVDILQHSRRLEHTKTRWITKLMTDVVTVGESSNVNEEVLLLHQHAITQAITSSKGSGEADLYPDRKQRREASPFLTARLAQISCQEYKNISIKKGMRMLEDDNRALIDWLRQTSDQAKQDEESLQQYLRDEMEAIRQEHQNMEGKKKSELHAILEERRKLLLSLRDEQVSAVQQRREALQTQRAPNAAGANNEGSGTNEVPPSLEEASDSSDWVDVDKEGSDWVDCAK